MDKSDYVMLIKASQTSSSGGLRDVPDKDQSWFAQVPCYWQEDGLRACDRGRWYSITMKKGLAGI